MPTWSLLANFLLFQAGWFACLLVDGLWLYCIVLSILGIHLLWIVPTSYRLTEMGVLLKVLLVGACLETAYFQLHILERTDHISLPPVWLLLIWVLFATTFSYSLSWLASKRYLAAIFAGVVAPLNYYAGTNLNDLVSLNGSSYFSLLSISFTWGIVFPVLLWWLVPPLSDRET